ncbi:MAG: serine/threonine-protein kinase, partial [Myxococcales bacterium]|nr:serine/threonine-protein kinase [Myxococcales bacterium]
MSAGAIQEGQVFDNHFRIQNLLGRGGMGEVWRAIDMRTQQPVAIKVLLEKAARKRDLVARFEREAKITGQIHSPYICPLLDSGRASSGELYLVFEMLEGESLSDRLRVEPQLDFDEAARYLDNVLEGLIAAHAAGVVHRDLKPANIFLTRTQGETRAVILDFGISKLLRRNRSGDEASLTTFDATLGSFAYMAPEQVRGAARADERADIYAVGVVAFRMLTSRLPFEGDNATSLLMGKMGLDPPTLGQVTGQQWPSSIEQFIARSLARHREARFATAQEALEA